MIESSGLRAGIALPDPPKPAANYEPLIEGDRTLSVSGQIHLRDGQLRTGKVGESISLVEAQEFARIATENSLAVVLRERGTLEGLTMNRLRVYVVGASYFQEHHLVGDGASNFLLEALGDRGRHSRTSIGVSGLPFGAAVEVELTFDILR